MLVPVVLIAGWFFSSYSFWAYPSHVFEFILKVPPPASVIDLHAEEHTFTDTRMEVFCRISPEDFEKIIKGGRFEESSYRPQTVAFKRSLIDAIHDLPPLVNAIQYSYVLPTDLDESHFPTSCTLYTNEDKTIIYAVYSTD